MSVIPFIFHGEQCVYMLSNIDQNANKHSVIDYLLQISRWITFAFVLTVITYAVLYTFNYLTVCEVSVEVSGKCIIEISDTSKEDIDSIYKSMWRTYITFRFLSHFWNLFTGSLSNPNDISSLVCTIFHFSLTCN